MNKGDEHHEDEELGESGEFHDEDLDEDFEEEEEFSEETSSLPGVAPKAPAAPGKGAAPSPSASAGDQQKLAPKDIPLTVVVEVGRIQISVQKLLELQPGNLLELDVHAENGVDLVVNGKAIGKGELLKIGDALGVRILDKG